MTTKKSLALPNSQLGPKGDGARVSKAIAARRSTGGIPWEEIERAVRALAAGRLLPQGVSVEAAIVACAKGAELGVPPMQAIQTIPIINGRPSMEAKLMLALAYRRLPGFDYQILKWDQRGCTIKARRSPQHSWVTVTYDEADAKAAGLLGKGTWKAHPKALYFARTCAMVCRAIAPDVFAGLYDPDEAASLGPESLDDLEPLEAVVIQEDAEPVNPISDEPMDAEFDNPALAEADDVSTEDMKDALRKVWGDPERRPSMQAELDRMGVSAREIATMPDDMIGDLYVALCT